MGTRRFSGTLNITAVDGDVVMEVCKGAETIAMRIQPDMVDDIVLQLMQIRDVAQGQFIEGERE